MANNQQRLATPSVLMELREESQVVREGFGFLDEKRLLLAAEILRQLERYEQLQRQLLEASAGAQSSLKNAVARHGLEALQLAPVKRQDNARLQLQKQAMLGVTLTSLQLREDPEGGLDEPLFPSQALNHCSQQFKTLAMLGAELAAISGNLERLQEEYRRTERRARALEDVILPELSQELCDVENRLGELDQEEAVRVRLHHNKHQR